MDSTHQIIASDRFPSDGKMRY